MALFSLLLAALLATTLPALAAPSCDFDQDGRSDLMLVSIQGDKSLSWLIQPSASGAASDLGQFGSFGVHLIPATWLGSSTPQIGVVSYDSSARVIKWSIKDHQGNTAQRSFGKKGDLVLSGGDLNGDGVADAVAARLSRKIVQWNIAYGPFMKPDGAVSYETINFGRSGSRVFFASPDGHNDWIGYFAKGSNGKAQLRLKDLLTSQIRSNNKFPSWIVSGNRPRPVPLKLPDGKDALLFIRSAARSTRIDVYQMNAIRVFAKTFRTTGDVVVGDFGAEPGEEIVIKKSAETSALVINPFSRSESQISTASGIAVDEINVQEITGSNSSTPTTDPTPPQGGGSDEQANCQSTRIWPSSHIYKIIGSEHFSPSDPRRHTAGLVIKPGGAGPFPSCVLAQDTKGNVIAKLGLYARGAGWEARYYAGIGCGSGTALGGSAIASRARANTGSPNIYMNFGSVCFGPIDAGSCIGSSQC